jgi:hypothetical protein
VILIIGSIMKKFKLFEAIIKQSFQTTSHFNINSPIFTPKDCINAFRYIEEQISLMANEIAGLLTSVSMRENYPIKESNDKVIREYRKQKSVIDGANKRIDKVINNLKIYLKQSPNEEVRNLDPAKNTVNRNIKFVDDELSIYNANAIEPHIDVTINCNVFYNTIKKFNRIIDEFNNHNHTINPSRTDNIEHIENIKNFTQLYPHV